MAQKGSKASPSLSKNLLSMKFMQRGAASAAQSDDSELWGPSGARTGPDIAPMTPDVPPVGRRSFLNHRSQPVAEPAAPATPSTPASTPSTPASAGSAGGQPHSGGIQGRPLFKRLSAMSPPSNNDRPNKARKSGE